MSDPLARIQVLVLLAAFYATAYFVFGWRGLVAVPIVSTIALAVIAIHEEQEN